MGNVSLESQKIAKFGHRYLWEYLKCFCMLELLKTENISVS